MKKGLKILLFSVVLCMLTAIGALYYVFNKPARNIESEIPSIVSDARTFYLEYSILEKVSDKKYANKVIQLSGTIAELSIDGYQVTIVLNDEKRAVNCFLDSLSINSNQVFINNLKLGDNITLKGRCDGFDMIMGVVLTHCFIIE